MKRFTSFVWSLLTGSVLLTSCAKKDDALTKGIAITHNDFESVLGWNGNTDGSVTTERAHSGKYALAVGPQAEYSYTYSSILGKMSTAKIRTITLSAWVWVPSDQVPGSLVLAIAHSPERSTPVFYGDISLAKEVKKFKEWQQVSRTFTLPDSIQDTNQLKCYLWRAGNSENVYADDIALRIEN
ncbi:carbohydrate binding domain-containing protein [Hymenobacter antarcticus]|uniref:carbohydrate binding domain-containing protein n=1 Tax=Hymenobacter antarcticus TaxID=486270 RepID=UPI0031EBC910